MNKFHKTTYGRQNYNNFINSSHGKRETFIHPHNQKHEQEHLLETHDRLKMTNLEKKVQIESSLLFNHKNNIHKPTYRPIETAFRKTTNRSEGKFYENGNGFSQAKERPQSKQEPRVKVCTQIDEHLKHDLLVHERPQTSKGIRNCRQTKLQNVRQRRPSENDQGNEHQIKLTKPTRKIASSYSKRTNQSNVMAFETSIDPEFLSLFAS